MAHLTREPMVSGKPLEAPAMTGEMVYDNAPQGNSAGAMDEAPSGIPAAVMAAGDEAALKSRRAHAGMGSIDSGTGVFVGSDIDSATLMKEAGITGHSAPGGRRDTESMASRSVKESNRSMGEGVQAGEPGKMSDKGMKSDMNEGRGISSDTVSKTLIEPLDKQKEGGSHSKTGDKGMKSDMNEGRGISSTTVNKTRIEPLAKQK